MKKKGTKIIIIIVLLILIYGVGVAIYSGTLVGNTSVYNEKIKSYDKEALEQLLAKKKIKLLVKDKRKEIELPLNEVKFEVSNASTIQKEMISKQESFKWPIIFITGQNFDAAKIEISENNFNKWLKEKKVISNEGMIESKDAMFNAKDENDLKIIPEVIGNELDKKLVDKKIKNSLENGELEIDLNNSIITPNVVKTDLEKTLKDVEIKLENVIKLEVEGKNNTINPSKEDRLSWLNIDYKKNTVKVEKKSIHSYLESFNQDQIKKAGSTKTIYKVANGVSTKLQDGKSVSGIDETELTNKIYNAMTSNSKLEESVKAKTISKPKVVYEGNPSKDNNMVEVSISQQKVYFYSNGKLSITADIVTGKPNGDTDTPKGKFTIMFKSRNWTLSGAAYGYDYKLPVDYWLPFEGGGGVGLHDAPWRSQGSFGGNLYLSSGSHGCINMRKGDVSRIYEAVVPGTAVWVH